MRLAAAHLRAHLLFLFCAIAVTAQHDPLAEAVAALESGDLATAERVLRAEVKLRPANADALGVLGVVLDQRKQYDEAGKIYSRAHGARAGFAPAAQ